ncbi:endonuclease/exonuclease/phosphatase family protein-like protein [Amylocarpus encephaloides]|uniref:Endonuclease/exonuclease/phosphatase family protein-like protein n=1 Tax=Amylocarpus encephaloides TaxID=45428 RepID=A0A9P7YJQ4_9HELO|nr:endonuclease/exonuclease/phosphatase family protein-like protein [Amylocarpus encephaloides]
MVRSAPSSALTDHTTKQLADLRVITHNIRYATETPFKGEELWPIRRPKLCSQLVFNSIAIPTTFICLQEVLHLQLVDILESLNASSPQKEWECIGVGRDDGKQAGEYSPIFYRRTIWKLLEWKTVWLSETPTKPSKGWDAASIRIVTIGIFMHIHSGEHVLVMSTHFDDQGAKSRQESAKLILATIKSETETHKFSTVVLAGDFNSPPGDGAYQTMTGSQSNMVDTSTLVPEDQHYGNVLTFTSFGYVDNDPSRIDFIFLRKGDGVLCRTFAVLANRFDDGVYLSDHRAVVIDLQLGG